MKWYNDTTHLFMSRGYLEQGQGILEKIKDIGDHAENILKIEGFSDKLQDYIKRGYYIIPTPVWKNFNAKSKESSISCFGVDIGDTVESIIFKAGEVGIQNKIGGGSSGYFGNIRPRGAKIGEDGKSNGTVAMMEIYQTISNIISQPNRRGHFSATLDIEHDDFHEFIRIRSEGHSIQDLSFSVSIGDEFMEKLLKGDEECTERFRKVIKSRYETGFPYIFFRDTVNRNTVDVYKDQDRVIKHSNMCVSGNTLILTDKGYLPIKELTNTYQEIWNGEQFSKSYISKTGENQKLIKVGVEIIYLDGFEEVKYLECTEYHKWYDVDHEELRTIELSIGEELYRWKTPNSVIKKATVVRIDPVKGLHDTYCFNEPLEHKGMFNGILTGQCHEIALPNTTEETFVCNLLGMNIEKFDEWRNNDAVEVGIYFMDAMLTDFIEKNRDSHYMQSAVRFAERHRAMGMGASGYHDYLQERMIPFESMKAKGINNLIFKTIKDKAYQASEKMAKEYDKPSYLESEKYNRRHTTLLCVAPNTSSAFIMGQQSQSIEPHISNYYVKDVAKIRIPIKNKNLIKLLEEKGENKDHVWEDILQHKGSVQHLPFLTDEEKQVFKTFSEISQLEILIQASSRQNHIDQSQSLNLMIPANLPIEDTAFLVIKAWELKIKTLYYQLNVSAAQELNIAGLARCISCEG